MRTTTMGRDGPVVGRLGLGAMGLSYRYAPGLTDRTKAVSLVQEAVDLGVNLLETADAYADGENERLIGEAIRGRRDEVVLCTGGGLLGNPDGVLRPAGGPQALRDAVDESLRRLHVDHIDLYLLRRIDPAVPLMESWGALAEQVWAGKIRMLGLPVVTVEQAREAEAVHEAAAIGAEVSLFTRCGLDDVVPYAVERRIALLAGAPLGRGLLTGAYSRTEDLAPDDWRRTQPRFAPRAIRHNYALTQAVAQVAARHEATPAQVALAWLLRLGDHVVPVPGTRASYHLAENLGGDRIRLTEQDMTDLEFLPYPAGSAEV
ncbi:aldo/keto reductase [Streptomyces sp. CFMR 7]|uniref:aldo/keto reductase n=1 Tax=Streptomyces sp. CFMR 7 TaxID=1649184 RepID=UPI0006AD2BB1|nr:aldo/keto reductase [Streptomyces sp. CFMR 7]ALC29072.1 aldo/keto reductase [Streptomyces sp. CFMR 7]